MKVRDVSSVGIEDIALGGKAIARIDGKVVFVDRGLPGDRASVRITKSNRRFAEARLLAVEQPSDARVPARCVHVDRCGGCRLQELPYEAQAALKERQVREVLRHLGGIAEPPVRTIVPAPAAWHYRNKMEYSFMPAYEPVSTTPPRAGATPDVRGMAAPTPPRAGATPDVRGMAAPTPPRAHATPGPDAPGTAGPAAPQATKEFALLGMHERGTFDRVFELRECWLPSPLTVEIVRFTQTFARTHGWRAYHPSRHDGVARFLTVRHLPHTASCAVHLLAASDDLRGLTDWARGVAALSSEIRTVTLGLNRSRANVAFAEEERVLVGDGVIVEKLLGLEFEVVGNAFLQTNSMQAERLYEGALAAAQLSGRERVLDLYCGAGTLTLLFARAAAEAVGVENVSESVERAQRNAVRNQLGNARFVLGDSRAVLREWARGERDSAPKPDVVVVDPPRAGLHPRVVARVAELAPQRIVYVSCNPATLARDLKDFAALGWRAAEVTPYDMFPHTPHIECVTRLERSAG